jgi:hypothetical protein
VKTCAAVASPRVVKSPCAEAVPATGSIIPRPPTKRILPTTVPFTGPAPTRTSARTAATITMVLSRALPVTSRADFHRWGTRTDCPVCARYATTSGCRLLHLAEGVERERGTFESSDESWLGDPLDRTAEGRSAFLGRARTRSWRACKPRGVLAGL